MDGSFVLRKIKVGAMNSLLKNFAYVEAGLFLASFLLAGPTVAADCDLSGKSLFYVVKLCTPSGQCKTGRERITIVGSNVARFDNPNQPVGENYILGQTVDLCDRQYGTGKDCHPIDPRLRITSLGTATYKAGDLSLKNELIVYAQGRPGGSFNMSILIRALGPACNTCRVLDLRIKTTAGVDWSLSESSSCDITITN